MKVFCSGVKGQKPVYSLENVSPSEMSVLNCALTYYRSHLMREGVSEELLDKVKSVIDDFSKVVVEK